VSRFEPAFFASQRATAQDGIRLEARAEVPVGPHFGVKQMLRASAIESFALYLVPLEGSLSWPRRRVTGSAARRERAERKGAVS